MAANVKKEEKSKSGPGFFGKISRFFRDILGEMKRVVWPSKKQVMNNTVIVIGFMIVASILIGGFDILLSQLVKLLMSLF
ncbi:preprotein translocase subunit SecE [Oscillospiraceae bacterium MB08-C2-2]|nr:preprotein translocase subunit SecE [Oscillospiraceae bacterium MB08-C2-2]